MQSRYGPPLDLLAHHRSALLVRGIQIPQGTTTEVGTTITLQSIDWLGQAIDEPREILNVAGRVDMLRATRVGSRPALVYCALEESGLERYEALILGPKLGIQRRISLGEYRPWSADQSTDGGCGFKVLSHKRAFFVAHKSGNGPCPQDDQGGGNEPFHEVCAQHSVVRVTEKGSMETLCIAPSFSSAGPPASLIDTGRGTLLLATHDVLFRPRTNLWWFGTRRRYAANKDARCPQPNSRTRPFLPDLDGTLSYIARAQTKMPHESPATLVALARGNQETYLVTSKHNRTTVEWHPSSGFLRQDGSGRLTFPVLRSRTLQCRNGGNPRLTLRGADGTQLTIPLVGPSATQARDYLRDQHFGERYGDVLALAWTGRSLLMIKAGGLLQSFVCAENFLVPATVGQPAGLD